MKQTLIFSIILFASISQAADFEGVFKTSHQTCTYNHSNPLENRCLTERASIELKVINDRKIEGRTFDLNGNETDTWIFDTSYAHNPEINTSVTSTLESVTDDSFKWSYKVETPDSIKTEVYTLTNEGAYFHLLIDRRLQFKGSKRVDFFIESLDISKTK